MRWASLLVGMAIALRAAPSVACATCGCGDPTLTGLGAEKPFQNRLRASLDFRYRTDAIGQPNVDRIDLQEARLDAQLAWAPTDRLFLLASAPILDRTVGYVNGARTNAFAFGDAELRLKAFVAQDRAFAPRHLFSLMAGLKLPTARREQAEDGSYLPIETQPGTGSWDPTLGLSYAYFPRPWSVYTSVQGSAPLRGTADFRASPSMRTTVSVQRQFIPQLAARLGFDGRLDARSFEDGRPERDSSGFVGFVTPQVLVSPTADLVVVLSAYIPVVEALAGYHDEGVIWGAAVAYDL